MKKPLIALLILYCAASLIHFIHNAEFLHDYPDLPESWSRTVVYLAWIGLTSVGLCGCFLLIRGFHRTGLIILAVYALLGLDSLGHYVVASYSQHTPGMNLTILLEVSAAALVLFEVVRQFFNQGSSPENNSA